MQYNFSNKKYLIRIERLFECQQLRLTQTLCTIENSKQRPRWMTQAKRSQCEWSVIKLREQSSNCFDCQSMYIVWDTKHLHFFQTTKYITSCSLKHFRDRWGTNCPARTTMTDPRPTWVYVRNMRVCRWKRGWGVEMSCCNYLYHKTVSKMIMSVQKTQDVN